MKAFASMTRRNLLATPALGAAAMAAAPPPAPGFRLRYGPPMGWLGPKFSVPDHMKAYAEAGFSAFEYNGLPRHSMAEIESFRKVREDLKLSMGTMVANRGGWRPTSLPDRGGHRTFLEDVKKAVEIHKIMGNEVSTVTSGLAVPNTSFEIQTQACVEALKRAGELCEKTSLVLVLEPLNHKVDHAGYFVVYSEHAAEIIGRTNHPQVKILFDMYHQQISEGNIINHLRQYWDLIGYLQTGDVPGRKEPYTGEMNYQNIFKAVSQLGYKGIIGLEHGMSEPGPDGFKKVTEAYRKADAWS
jgi:hydroxypyruvate isomerase